MLSFQSFALSDSTLRASLVAVKIGSALSSYNTYVPPGIKPISIVPALRPSPTASKLVPTVISTSPTLKPSLANSSFNIPFKGSVAVTISAGSFDGTKPIVNFSISTLLSVAVPGAAEAAGVSVSELPHPVNIVIPNTIAISIEPNFFIASSIDNCQMFFYT